MAFSVSYLICIMAPIAFPNSILVYNKMDSTEISKIIVFYLNPKLNSIRDFMFLISIISFARSSNCLLLPLIDEAQ